MPLGREGEAAKYLELRRIKKAQKTGACILKKCVGHCQIVGKGGIVSFQLFMLAWN
jgi:hypothetical protein